MTFAHKVDRVIEHRLYLVRFIGIDDEHERRLHKRVCAGICAFFERKDTFHTRGFTMLDHLSDIVLRIVFFRHKCYFEHLARVFYYRKRICKDKRTDSTAENDSNRSRVPEVQQTSSRHNAPNYKSECKNQTDQT